ncbi:MAG: aldehyde dehydrogenase family protein [Paracoccaceae bacterium]|jgi:aldehyde dehydrogenase (NAD+)|nr:aldehyde dehydrogenase family protein [Paracoccaceae bacterium]
MLNKRSFYINGSWVEPEISNDFNVVDPSTEENCAVISLGSQADTNKAVKAARDAFESWMFTPKNDRLKLIENILEEYELRAEDMAKAISLEMGAPIEMARQQQVGTGLNHIKGFINVFKEFQFDQDLRSDTPHDKILYEPVGVCGLITPWNWPMNQVTLKTIPAIAAGCTMVLKPSEIAPLSSIVFSEILHEAGCPPGVFNMVNGDGLGVGTQLSSHPDVDMISFTGSTRAGIAISKAAADTLKRVTLELGGKGANLIFDDADEKAIKNGVLRVMNNSGQSCNAPTRMMVESSIYENAVTIAAEVANSISVSSGHETGRHIGPVVSEIQFNKIQNLIEKGIDEGAKLVAGGTGRPEGLNRGYYIKPTVFADVTPDMTIYREEIFGPVLSIMPFDNEDHAVELANDTNYGLTNYVQSEDDAKRNRVARRLRSGMVEMNGLPRSSGSPFGGYKQSGNGREGGIWGLEDFLEVKSVSGWSN